MRISTKLIVNTTVIAVFSVFISTLAIGWMVYINADRFLEKMSEDRFISLRDSKADQVREYYNTIKKQIKMFSHDYTVIKAMRDFSAAFNEYSVPPGEVYKADVIKHYVEQFVLNYAELNAGQAIDARKLLNMLDGRAFSLQYNYVLQNPYPINSKSKYNYVKDGSKYSYVHNNFHPIIRKYQETFKYDDILLVDSKTGNIVYSVQKELDYTSSLINGPCADTAIGKAFRLANAATTSDFYILTDFHEYIPIYNNMIQFIASPIFDENGIKIGVLIFRIASNSINDIMTSNGKWKQAGWGDTGETYIIGKDSVMRTNSRFFVDDPLGYLKYRYKLGDSKQEIKLMQAKKTTIGIQKINSVGEKEVIKGKTGVSYYKDYRKQPVVAAYEPLDIEDLGWGVICGMDTKEAFASIYLLINKIIIYGIVIMVIIFVVTIYIGMELSKRVSSPIEKYSNIINFLAKKQDLTKRIKVNTDDELGEMATAINTLMSNLQQACKNTIESTRQVQSVATKLFSTNASPSDIANKTMTDSFVNDIPAFEQKEAQLSSEAEDSLQALSSRLEDLSKQFKIFEEESDRTSGW